MMISAIIPTRNRPASLRVTLRSLLAQSRRPDEIIVVDSSDEGDDVKVLRDEFSAAGVRWLHTSASVCLQRNTGIQNAAGDWIFLCDDDIELDSNYLFMLGNYLAARVDCGAVAGRLLQREGDLWTDQYPVKSFAGLLWRFLFQLSIWGAIDRFYVPVLARPAYYLLQKFYSARGNTLSFAGWPLITNWNEPVIQTSVYSLGATLVRKDWLPGSPYDEVLDPGGIGDNYGVALRFSGRAPIHVIGTTFAYHHRARQNRENPDIVYYRRILALHYFIKRNRGRFPFTTPIFFVWSLFGKAIFFFGKGDHRMLAKTLKVIWLTTRGKNPYWVGFLNGKKNLRPE